MKLKDMLYCTGLRQSWEWSVMWYDSLRWCGLAVREENENDLAKSCMDYEVESVDH